MKKIAKLLFATVISVVALIAATSAVSAAQHTIVFTRPSFDIVINGYVIDETENMYREYPFYVYNGITYFPMTYNDCATLGIRNDWTSYGGNHITYGYDCADYKPTYNYYGKSGSAVATIAGDFSTDNGKLYNSYEQYPIYSCNDILYFPMTWEWTSRFGWTNTFINNTLYITADVEYSPVSLINRRFYTEYGGIYYEYDVVNNTGNGISSWKYKIEYLDYNMNPVRDNDGYTGSFVSGDYLAPYAVKEENYVDLSDDLEGVNCQCIWYHGITEVVFSDGTVWRKPLT